MCVYLVSCKEWVRWQQLIVSTFNICVCVMPLTDLRDGGGELPLGPISFITGRNEVVAKVMFLLVSVILLTGEGVSASMHAGIPPRSRPPPPSRHPPGADTSPEQTSPRSRHPPRKQTLAYGRWAVGTHPTGMHSCFHVVFPLLGNPGSATGIKCQEGFRTHFLHLHLHHHWNIVKLWRWL